MTRKLRVLLDVDNVILDFTRHLLHSSGLLDSDGWIVTPGATVDFYEVPYNFFDLWKSRNPGEWGEVQKDFLLDWKWWSTLPALPDIAESLRRSGLDNVYFITSPYVPCPRWFDARLTCLKKIFPTLDVENRLLAVPSEQKKYTDGDILVEDNAQTLREWCHRSSTRRGYLFTWPWNKNADVATNTVRVHGGLYYDFHWQAFTRLRERGL